MKREKKIERKEYNNGNKIFVWLLVPRARRLL